MTTIALIAIVFISISLLEITKTVHASVGDNPYTIKMPPEENGETENVLLLYSLPKNNEEATNAYKKQLQFLEQILESHWNIDIQSKDYADVLLSTALEFPFIIFFEQNHSEFAQNFFGRIIQETEGKTMWIGFGSDTILPIPASQSSPTQPVIYTTYKGVKFEIDDTFSIHNSFPKNSAKFETLFTYSTDGVTDHPLAGIYNKDHILVPINPPFHYDVKTYSYPFLDLFHHLFGHHNNKKTKPALLRFEDVNVFTYRLPHKLNKAYRYLQKNDIPFHIAFIEHYLNPPRNIDMHSDGSERFLFIIKKMVTNGDAVLIQHGYTHQTGDGVSAADFEFWDPVNGSPLAYDSKEYVRKKIALAKASMQKAGLPIPDVWETPHYAYSALDSEVFNEAYPIRYEHMIGVGSLPYVANIDNTIIIPENLGYIYKGINELEEKKLFLKKLNTFEDPVASVFWHPWRDSKELEMLTTLIEDGGFTFVSLYDLIDEKNPAYISAFTVIKNKILINLKIILTYLVYISFIIGTLIYFKNVYKVRKHLKMISAHTISLKKIYEMMKETGETLPRLGIFIPARNEGLVIANTLRNLSKLVYPKDKMHVYVIVDERELDDNVSPTTKDITREVAKKLHATFRQNFIKIIEVPKWYSGNYGCTKKTYVKSTKGRALNYCLQSVNSNELDMIGILDADGRLHKNVLLEVAEKRITLKSKILQGPVFQINNFGDVTITGIAAGLELALHHLTELPTRLMKQNRVQFLAGTNYFVDTNCITKAGGWDQHALVEDAELALRLYVRENIFGDWINSPELEQTPANFSIYKKQRERWVRGHIDLLKQIRKSSLSWKDKLHLYKKIYFSQFRFLFDIALPILSIYLLTMGVFAYLDPIFSHIGFFLMIGSVFIWDTYGFIYRELSYYINPHMKIRNKIFQSIRLALFLPVFIVIQSIPRMHAIYNAKFNPSKNAWYKTERTSEAITKY